MLKKDIQQIAFLTMTTLSNNNSANDSSLYESIVAKVVGGTSLNNSISLGYTIGYNINSSGSDEWAYSLLISNAFNDKFSFFIEFYGYWLYQSYQYNSTINFDLGLAYMLNNKMQIDTYFGTGLNNNMYFGSVGFSYLFLK